MKAIYRPIYEAIMRTMDVGDAELFYKAKPQCVRNAARRAFGAGNYTSRSRGRTVLITRLK